MRCSSRLRGFRCGPGRWIIEALLVLAGMILCAVSMPAAAHKSSDSYLQIDARSSGLEVRWDIALRDLDAVMDIDANADGNLTWGEVKQGLPAIDAYALPRLGIEGCPLTLERHSLEKRNDGAYAVLWLRSACVLKAPPNISYRLFVEIDPTHRGIARIDREGSALQLRVLDPHATLAASTAEKTEAAGMHTSFLIEGMTHILGGYDHVLFLLCLLLPAVRRRPGAGAGEGDDLPVANLWQAVLPVAGIVTAFTVAHSITLGLAALKIVSIPSAVIEPAIAVTIMVAAIDNVWHLFGGHRAIVTFFFGLIHGFGFAGVLGELNLPTADFALALFEFNVGLELGQLVIVVVALSVLYLLRANHGYRRWVIHGGSLVAGMIALVWFAERVSGMKWLPV